MPPRHAYWTILIDDQPTAFRAHDPEELLPTLNRLREKNENAVMKWFERGQLFDSRDQAREAGLGRGERRWEGPRPDRDDWGRGRDADGPRFSASSQRKQVEGSRGENRGPRDKYWRPGGEHRDPRQQFKDAKKAKWNRFKDKIRERHSARPQGGASAPPERDRFPESFAPPHGEKLRDRHDRPQGDTRDRRTVAPWNRGTAAKPHGDNLRSRAPKKEWRRDDNRLGEGPGFGRRKKAWGATTGGRDFPDRRGPGGGGSPAGRGPKPSGGSGRKPWGSKPAGNAGRRKPWSSKPAGAGLPRASENSRGSRGAKKPWGSKPGGRGPSPSPPRRRRDDDE